MNIKDFPTIQGCTTCGHKLCAKKVSLFHNLNTEQLELIVSLVIRKHYKKGDYLLHHGEPFDVLYIVNSGRLKATHYSEDGREQILHIIDEGESFGELSLLKKSTIPYDLIAMKECHLCTVPKKEFDALIVKHPEIMLSILSAAHDHIMSLEAHVSAVTSNDADVRLKFLIKSLSKKAVLTHNGLQFRLDITREDMANYVGVTRETISRKISKLSKEGTIKMIDRNTLCVVDPSYLEI